jgi:hypothetical protein
MRGSQTAKRARGETAGRMQETQNAKRKRKNWRANRHGPTGKRRQKMREGRRKNGKGHETVHSGERRHRWSIHREPGRPRAHPLLPLRQLGR